MSDRRHDLGIAAEAAVGRWLEQSGWRVVAQRRRSDAGGEVDLIAMDPQGILVALEVRARHTERAGAGWETIDRRRTARLGRTLAAFAAERSAHHCALRIDLVLVTRGERGGWSARRIPNIGG